MSNELNALRCSMRLIAGDLLCEMKSSGSDDVNRAVSAAKHGLGIWSGMTGMERSKVLHKAAILTKVGWFHVFFTAFILKKEK